MCRCVHFQESATVTPSQADLLRRLIAADRDYRSHLAAGQCVSADDRGVEVGLINGVHRSTAHSLVAAGLAEMLDIGRGSNSWLFLGSYDPYDAVAQAGS
jgi:hypothetical protein